MLILNVRNALELVQACVLLAIKATMRRVVFAMFAMMPIVKVARGLVQVSVTTVQVAFILTVDSVQLAKFLAVLIALKVTEPRVLIVGRNTISTSTLVAPVKIPVVVLAVVLVLGSAHNVSPATI